MNKKRAKNGENDRKMEKKTKKNVLNPFFFASDI